jgi:hypothetical protein
MAVGSVQRHLATGSLAIIILLFCHILFISYYSNLSFSEVFSLFSVGREMW